jgi:hypothetical protein
VALGQREGHLVAGQNNNNKNKKMDGNFEVWQQIASVNSCSVAKLQQGRSKDSKQ